MIARRKFLAIGMGFVTGLIFRGLAVSRDSPFPQFFIAQLKYRGGEWNPNPGFTEAIIEELELRTSIEAHKQKRVITLSEPDLFYCPFLYMTGKYDFEPFTPQERAVLRRFLTYGGFLLAEDTLGAKGFGFDRAFRTEMKLILPKHELKRLPSDHSVYRSFYLLETVAGRQRVTPYLEGITIDQWTPVIYSQNDLSGAWEKDRFGKWVHECIPGGETQRALAFKTGINIIVYSLTGDYKKDVVHHPFIKKRLSL